MTDTDIAALVERLRGWSGKIDPISSHDIYVMTQAAADALEALQTQLKGSDTLKSWQEHWQARAEKAEQRLVELEAALAERNAAS